MKKIKSTLVMFLVVVLICFLQQFAGSNQNVKLKKSVNNSRNVKLLDNGNVNQVDQYTKLLMHMDDGTFKDECGHAITNNGVTLDTTNKKFGSGSASFNGNNAYLGIAKSDDCNLSNKDFTLECWVKLGQKTSGQIIQCGGNAGTVNSNWSFYLSSLNTVSFYASTGTGVGSQIINNSFSKVDDGLFHHYEVDRKGSNFYFFLDGNLINSISQSAPIKSDSQLVTIGFFTGGESREYFQGNIDELSLSVGIARHTSNFPIAISLDKTTDSLPVDQSHQLTATVTPNSAANKTVKWKSSDTKIVTVDDTGKITAVGEGTATITAFIDGSNLSASCAVTVTKANDPTPTTDNSDKATLNITMTNGQVKQYNVTMDVVNKFISWYKLRSAGSGDPFYEFDITQSSNPNIKKTDYVVFDKISSFEVDDYTK